jgi:DnaJ-class molecular chaperone
MKLMTNKYIPDDNEWFEKCKTCDGSGERHDCSDSGFASCGCCGGAGMVPRPKLEELVEALEIVGFKRFEVK